MKLCHTGSCGSGIGLTVQPFKVLIKKSILSSSRPKEVDLSKSGNLGLNVISRYYIVFVIIQLCYNQVQMGVALTNNVYFLLLLSFLN